MNTYTRTLLTGVALLALSGAAMATPTLVGSTTNASGIDGIMVDTVTYDVTFSTSSFDSTFSTEAGAIDAATALAADLQALQVTGLSFGGASGENCNHPLTFCDIFTGDSSQSWTAHNTRTDFWEPNFFGTGAPECPGDIPLLTISFCDEAAHWTVVSSSVPEPSTVALFALGLVGVGLSRRRLAR